jgi:hypothetical protein
VYRHHWDATTSPVVSTSSHSHHFDYGRWRKVSSVFF